MSTIVRTPRPYQYIIDLIAKRDEIPEGEAEQAVEECREQMKLVIKAGNPFEAEEILADYLGLEPDYLLDMLP